MAKARFPYLKVDVPSSSPFPFGQTLYKPVTSATITASTGRRLRLRVCLDTGADCCVFPLEVAIALGIDVISLPSNTTAGVGSTANVTYYDTVTIDLGQGITVSAYVGFTEAMNVHGLGLLGQEGFFDKFDVTFSHPGTDCPHWPLNRMPLLGNPSELE